MNWALRGGSGRGRISPRYISTAVKVCVCLCVPVPVASLERGLIQPYSAVNIMGAISSAALFDRVNSHSSHLVSAICILRMEKSYCKVRTLFSSFCFLSPSPLPPSLLTLSHTYVGFQYCLTFGIRPTQWLSCVLFTLLKLSKSLTLCLFTMRYLS